MEENVKKKMQISLVSLMEEKAYGDISVTDICARAGVSRMAFYRTVKTKEDLIKGSIRDVAVGFLSKWKGVVISDWKKYYEQVFGLCYEHKHFFEILDGAGLMHCIKDVTDECFFSAFNAFEGEKSEYESGYYAGAFFSLYTLWQKNGWKETPAQIAEIYCDISMRGWGERKIGE